MKIYMIGNGFFWGTIGATAGLAALSGLEFVAFGDRPATGIEGLLVIAALCLIFWIVTSVTIGVISYGALRIWARLHPTSHLEKY
jgi:hypothetical protein|tara:strand:+ start:7554 stop:7808 length:255 start_codon:yes stop_codon:yes gene_type:complete